MQTRIAIAAAPADVWQALVDVADWPRWTASMDSVEPLDPGPLRLGSRARVKQPGMPPLVWRVSEITEGRSFAWQARSAGVVTTGNHVLSPTAQGTSLLLTLEQRGPLAGLIRLLMSSRTRRYLGLEAAGLKACAEQRAEQRAAGAAEAPGAPGAPGARAEGE